MSRFNRPQVRRSDSRLTTNLAGGLAHSVTPKLELTLIALTSFLKDNFYRSAQDTMQRIVDLIPHVPRAFVMQLALYARHHFGMRSVTHLLAVELAAQRAGDGDLRPFIQKVIHRPDDALEIMACWLEMYGKPIPNALRRGIGDALRMFPEYALAKYRKNNAGLTMRDLVRLTRPRATDALTKLMQGTLASADTWESQLSAAGQQADGEDLASAKAEVWESLVRERRLGYMALIRNLRNISQTAPHVLPQVCEQLLDMNALQRSKMFPYRFFTAYMAALHGGVPDSVLVTLTQACDMSLANVPTLEGRTLVVLDVSGSMIQHQAAGSTPNSRINCAQVGALFASAILKKNLDTADFMIFDSTARYLGSREVDRSIPILRMTDQISRNCTGNDTRFDTIFTTANRAYARVIILSDMQGWGHTHSIDRGAAPYFERYGRPFIYSFNLKDYGTLMFPQQKTFALGGFSEKIFDLIPMMEGNPAELVQSIECFEVP